MTSVTVLGLGPMGQALSAGLLDANYPLTVWNRTESKADALRPRGAAWAATPGDAIAASDVTMVNVVDHAVVDSLLEAAGGAVSARTVVGLTSDTPDSARQTAKLVENLGGRYLDGAIMTPTPTIGTSSASILLRAHAKRTRQTVSCSPRWPNRAGSARSTAAPPVMTWRCSTCSGPR